MAANFANINTAGVTNLFLQYDFIGNGQGLTDNASSLYSINGGGAFTPLDASLKSASGCGRQGRWTQRSYHLPANCNNINNFQIRFNWTNDDDGAGSDPSVAINNILLRDSIPLPGDTVVQTVTLTQPIGPHFITAALSIVNPTCGQNNGAINNVGVAGGTSPYTLVWKISGAQIGTGNSLTNIGAGTYTFEVTDQSGCVIDTSFTLISFGNGNPVTVAATPTTICASDSVQVCVTTTHASYIWNIGDTARCFYTRLAGNYYVTVTDNGNCTATSNHLAISVYPSLPVSISINGDTITAYNAVDYQWYFNGGEITGATDSVYIATQSGSYTVAVIDTNGCRVVSNPVNVTISGLKEYRISKVEYRIYPNPTNDELTIEVTNDLIGKEISITDLSGRCLMQQRITAAREKVETANLHSGIYFVRVGNSVKRFVKL